MLNFAIGPVMMESKVLEIGAKQLPYFRTGDFSAIMKENEAWLLDMLSAPEGARCVFLTASGTGAMEASVSEILGAEDKALIINGGTFGQRFVNLCRLHGKNSIECKLPFGKNITREMLETYVDRSVTTLLVNMNETSSGTLYDMRIISDFCKEHDLFLMIDAIGSFLADDLDMEDLGADVVIVSSQKALALPPGLSMVALSKSALSRVENYRSNNLYLSIKEALKDGERGQTPFTPAVSILLQLHYRLSSIRENGGTKKEQQGIRQIAVAFRKGIEDLPLTLFSENPSNAVSALYTQKENAKQIVDVLRENYQIWVCPNGGEYAQKVFRVGHLGAIQDEDNEKILVALSALNAQGLL